MVFGSVVIAAKVIYCDLPKVLIDKSQVCAFELVSPEYFVLNIKTLNS